MKAVFLQLEPLEAGEVMQAALLNFQKAVVVHETAIKRVTNCLHTDRRTRNNVITDVYGHDIWRVSASPSMTMSPPCGVKHVSGICY